MEKKPPTLRTYKVRTQYNNSGNSKGQKFNGLSMTVPDQAIPLQVLLERHVKGLPINVATRLPLYEDEEQQSNSMGGINPATLDLADMEKLKTMNQIEIQDLTKQFESEKGQSQKDKAAKEAAAKLSASDTDSSKKPDEPVKWAPEDHSKKH